MLGSCALAGGAIVLLEYDAFGGVKKRGGMFH